MKTIGIIGGLGPESTVDYYQMLLAEYRAQTCKPNNPYIVIVSVDIVEILGYVTSEEYDKLTDLLADAVNRLNAAGADIAAISSNTPHIVFEQLKKKSPIQLVSIVDAACTEIKNKGYKKALLTGTRFTMEKNIYAPSARDHGVNVIVPAQPDIDIIHNVIFPELEDGIIIPEKKAQYIALCEKYIKEQNVDSVILGCTELPLMIKPGDLSVPTVNTSEIHVKRIVSSLF